MGKVVFMLVQTLRRFVVRSPYLHRSSQKSMSKTIVEKSKTRRHIVTMTVESPKKAGSRAERMAMYQGRQKHSISEQQERSHTASSNGHTSEETSPSYTRRELTIDELLPIDGLIPHGFDLRCVKTVIYWGFLRPARKIPLVNGSSAPREGVIRSVIGKKYPFDQVSSVIDMLGRMRLVIFSHHGGGRDEISLTTKSDELMSAPARKIAQICRVAIHQLKKKP